LLRSLAQAQQSAASAMLHYLRRRVFSCSWSSGCIPVDQDGHSFVLGPREA
jgi:hypothetical protein